MTNDELEKLIEKLVNTAQRGTRQTRDGSHLDLDKIKEQQDKLDDTYFSNLKSFSKSKLLHLTYTLVFINQIMFFVVYYYVYQL